jgi:hypothetical protein
MDKLVDHWIGMWEIGLWEDVELPQSLLFVGIATVSLAFVIGATARTAHSRPGQSLGSESPVVISENLLRFVSLLIWANIAWGIGREVRRRREVGEEKR